jgi:hypothetical protein
MLLFLLLRYLRAGRTRRRNDDLWLTAMFGRSAITARFGGLLARRSRW